jgi:hypothetical protein
MLINLILFYVNFMVMRVELIMHSTCHVNADIKHLSHAQADGKHLLPAHVDGKHLLCVGLICIFV